MEYKKSKTMKKPCLDLEARWHIRNETLLGNMLYSDFLLLKLYVLLTKTLRLEKILNWLSKKLC